MRSIADPAPAASESPPVAQPLESAIISQKLKETKPKAVSRDPDLDQKTQPATGWHVRRYQHD